MDNRTELLRRLSKKQQFHQDRFATVEGDTFVDACSDITQTIAQHRLSFLPWKVQGNSTAEKPVMAVHQHQSLSVLFHQRRIHCRAISYVSATCAKNGYHVEQHLELEVRYSRVRQWYVSIFNSGVKWYIADCFEKRHDWNLILFALDCFVCRSYQIFIPFLELESRLISCIACHCLNVQW